MFCLNLFAICTTKALLKSSTSFVFILAMNSGAAVSEVCYADMGTPLPGAFLLCKSRGCEWPYITRIRFYLWWRAKRRWALVNVLCVLGRQTLTSGCPIHFMSQRMENHKHAVRLTRGFLECDLIFLLLVQTRCLGYINWNALDTLLDPVCYCCRV